MKRTTIMLPDDLAQLVDRERRRRDVSAAAVIREAVAAYLGDPSEPKRFSFIGIASSGGGEYTGATMEEWLAREARSDEAFHRMKHGHPETDHQADASKDAAVDASGDLPRESGASMMDHDASATG